VVQAGLGKKVRPSLQNNQSKKDWRCGSRSRAPAFQARSSEFTLQVPLKQQNKKPHTLSSNIGSEHWFSLLCVACTTDNDFHLRISFTPGGNGN
jgi:hypothetical protein